MIQSSHLIFFRIDHLLIYDLLFEWFSKLFFFFFDNRETFSGKMKVEALTVDCVFVFHVYFIFVMGFLAALKI